MKLIILTIFFFINYANLAKAGDISACTNEIKRSTDHYQFVDQYRGGGFSWCVNKPPYVHIVIAKINDARNTIGISAEEFQGKTNAFKLKPIQEHAQSNGAWVAINGIYWEGGFGALFPVPTKDNSPYGRFSLTHYVNGRMVKAPVKDKAEMSFGFLEKSLYGVNLTRFFDKPAGKYLRYRPFSYNLISSDTSIIKYGKCSVGSEVSRADKWSAVGVRSTSAKDQYLVMVSSSSGHQTNGPELCEIFKALGVPYAMRLDGGHSTGIYFNGKHLNPNNGCFAGFDSDNPDPGCANENRWRVMFGRSPRILSTLYVK